MQNNKFSTQSNNFSTKKKKNFSNEHRPFMDKRVECRHFVEMNIFNLDLDIDSEFFDLLHPRKINSRLLLRPETPSRHGITSYSNGPFPFIPACIDGFNESCSAKRCRSG